MALSRGKVQRNGLCVAHEADDPLVDIVVLHGFNSSIMQAFTHDNGRNWVLDRAYWGDIGARVRVMTFQYNANAFRDVIVARIVDHAGKLLEDLYHARTTCKTRPLIFIAHSMGGLVTKRALVEAKIRDHRFGDILQATTSIVFMATPHLGASNTGVLGLAQRLASWSHLRSSSHVELSQELATFSDVIDEINRAFRPDHIDIVDIYELEKTKLPAGSILIVEKASAILPFPREHFIPSEATHRDICRFESPEHGRFRDLWQQIRDCVEKATAAHSSVVLIPDVLPTKPTQRPAKEEASLSLGNDMDHLASEQAHIPGENINQFVPSTIESTTDIIKRPIARAQEKDAYDREDYRNILMKLDAWKEYRQREERLRCHPGTCEWIFGNKTFQQWCQPFNLDVRSSILYIVGPSGCGKSVMTQHVSSRLASTLNAGELPFQDNSFDAGVSAADGIRQSSGNMSYQDQTTVLRFFCRASQSWSLRGGLDGAWMTDEQHSRSPPIIEAFLYQLLDSQRHLCSLAKSLLPHGKHRPDSADVKRMFRYVVTEKASGHLVLLIDGIDECEEGFNLDLLEYLHNLVEDFCATGSSHKDRSLKVYISCQPIYPIPVWSCQHLTIHAQLDNIRKDIIQYTTQEVQRIARDRSFGPDLTIFTTRLLEQYSGASFLWASLILTELRQLPVISETMLQAAITTFPSHLDQNYAKALVKVGNASAQAPSRESSPGLILIAILFSQWDLNLKELVELAAISEAHKTHIDLSRSTNNDISALISRYLGSLVVVESERVFIAHHSVRTFLDSIWNSPLQVGEDSVSLDNGSCTAHSMMAEMCLRYLLLEDFARLPETWYFDIQGLDQRYPFLKYATFGLVYHLRGAARELNNLRALLLEFLNGKSRNFTVWERCYHIRRGQNIRSATTSALAFLCKIGLEKVYELVVGVGSIAPSPSNPFCYERAKLQFWKLMGGSFTDSTQRPAGAMLDLNTLDSTGIAPIHYAASHQQTSMLVSLEHHGACLSLRDYWSGTSLHHAAYNNSVPCIEYLLTKGLDIEAQNCYNFTPLALAAARGSAEVVSLLLKRGAAVDPDVDVECRPLFVAANEGQESVALSLLTSGSGFHLKTTQKESILHYVARKNMSALVQALLSLAPNLPLDERNASGKRPLQLAAMCGATAVFEILINNGADLDLSYDSVFHAAPEIPLALAISHDHTSIALKLIRLGAKFEIQGWQPWSLLHSSALNGNLTLCKALQEAGHTINSQDSNKCTPLWVAAANHHTDIVAWLLSTLVKTEDILVFGGTALRSAAFHGNVGAVSLLLEYGADVNATNEDDVSALHLAICQRHTDVIAELLAHDPKLELRAKTDGETALSMAVLLGDLEIVQLLLRHGALIEVESPRTGGMPMHQAVFKDHVEIAKSLFDAGGSFSTRSKFGETCLMLACRRGNLTLMDFIYAHISIDEETGLYHEAAKSGKKSILEWTFRKIGLRGIDEADDWGFTPFHVACLKTDNVEASAWFLDYDVSIDRVTRRGSSALHLAALAGNALQVRFLLGRSLSTSVRTNSDYTPLELAAINGQTIVLKELISNTNELNHPNRHTGCSPLHLAITARSLDCVKSLVESGAQIESQNFDHETPLLFAISRSDRRITSYLVNRSASLDARNGRGLTAYELTMSIYHGFNPKRTPSEHKRIALNALPSLLKEGLGDDLRIVHNVHLITRYLFELEDHESASELDQCTRYTNPKMPDEQTSAATSVACWVKCTFCHTAIQSERFKCLVCDDVDVCLACHRKWNLNGCSHAFLHIPSRDPDFMRVQVDWKAHLRKLRAKLESVWLKYHDVEFASEEVEGGAGDGESSSIDVATSLFLLRGMGVDVFANRTLWLRGPYGLPFYQSRSLWWSGEKEAEYRAWQRQRRLDSESDDYDDGDDEDDDIWDGDISDYDDYDDDDLD